MNKTLLGRLIGGSLVAISTISLAVATISWFVSGYKNEGSIDGEIGLRGYFYTGDGGDPSDNGKPFEIVAPQHLYNLCRLQSLGVFSSKTYFQVGHKIGDDYYCMDENNELTVNVLDMTDFCKKTALLPIGSEETPFSGVFEGNGIPVKGVVVKGNPEDIGFFGYISHEGEVKNLICDTIDVYSLGYGKGNTGDNRLFGQNIDDIFDANADYLATETSFQIVEGNNSPENLKSNTLNRPTELNPRGGKILSDISSNYIEGTKIYNGAYFKPVFPDQNSHSNDRFDYSVKSSSALLVERVVDNEKRYYIDLGKFPTETIDGQTFFTQSVSFGTRLSLIASVDEGTLTYSRVIQSYSFQFESDADVLYQFTSDVNENNQFTTQSWREVTTTTEFSEEKTYNQNDIVIYNSRFYKCHTAVALAGDWSGSTNWSLVDSFDTTASYSTGDYVVTRSGISARILCDYVKDTDDYATNYHHGTNVGLLAGHVDGSFTDSYVYNGTLHLNAADENNYIKAESDTALIGETGANVNSTLNPEYDLSNKGDTGVLNLTKIYNGIRRDVVTVPAGTVTVGKDGGNTVLYYREFANINDPMFKLFEPYLRRSSTFSTESITEYITKADNIKDPAAGTGTAAYHTTSTDDFRDNWNSVDFVPKQLIQDEYDSTGENKIVDRGLGVFKIATSWSDSNPTQYTNLGQTMIINGKPKTKVYFSTAEYAWKKQDENGNWVNYESNQPTWGTGTGQISPLREATLPSYSNSATFKYPFSRDFNYCFELNLAKMNKSGGYNYMWNTDSTFLQNYLSSILIDKTGRPIKPRDKRFGFMFRKDNKETLDALSSYMVVGNPSSSSSSMKDYGDGQKHPSNSIVFEIKNTNGANVSIVGNGGDITIYGYDPSKTTKPFPIYRMRSSNTVENVEVQSGAAKSYYEDLDAHRYFVYDIDSGSTSTKIKTEFYSNEMTYDVGDIVARPTDSNFKTNANFTWYRCTVEIPTPEEWNPDHWAEARQGSGGNTYYPGEIVTRNGYLWRCLKQITTPNTSTGFGTTLNDNKDCWERVDHFMHDHSALYAHIFKLPPGHYAIGASGTDANPTAASNVNIYFLAAQGQTDGTIITDELPDVGNVIKDVDFLLSRPEYNNELNKAYFSFEITFNDLYPGVINVNVYSPNDDNKKYPKVVFKNSPAFVTYLYLHSRMTLVENRVYYVSTNDGQSFQDITISDYVYPL